MAGIDGYDWSVFGGNPAPGDPDTVRSIGSRLRDLADSVEAQNRLLRSVGGDSESVWVGPAANAFRPHLHKLPGQLDKLTTSYRDAADALDGYWPRLQAAQQLAVQAWHRAQAAQTQIHSAQARVASTSQAAGAAADAYNKAVTTAAAAPPDPTGSTAAHVSSLQSAYQAASNQLSSAHAALAAGNAALQAAHSMAESARTQARTSARQAAAVLHQAGNAGIHNPHHSWFSSIVDGVESVVGDVTHFAEHHWQEFVPGVALAIDAGKWLSHNWVQVLKDTSAVLGGIATVAGFVALIPGIGEVALPVALIASLAATADDAALAATGNGKWQNVILDGVGDLGFGAGEGLGFLARGMNRAEQLSARVAELGSREADLAGRVGPLEQGASRWAAMGERQVIQVGRDGGAEVTKASDLAAQARADAQASRTELQGVRSELGQSQSELAGLPGAGGRNPFTYSLRTLSPSEEAGTINKVRSFLRNPAEYSNSVLHPSNALTGESSQGAMRLIRTEGHEMWSGAGRIPYRVAVGVGVGGTGLGAQLDYGAWHDALGGKG